MSIFLSSYGPGQARVKKGRVRSESRDGQDLNVDILSDQKDYAIYSFLPAGTVYIWISKQTKTVLTQFVHE